MRPSPTALRSSPRPEVCSSGGESEQTRSTRRVLARSGVLERYSPLPCSGHDGRSAWSRWPNSPRAPGTRVGRNAATSRRRPEPRAKVRYVRTRRCPGVPWTRQRRRNRIGSDSPGGADDGRRDSGDDGLHHREIRACAGADGGERVLDARGAGAAADPVPGPGKLDRRDRRRADADQDQRGADRHGRMARERRSTRGMCATGSAR